MKSFTKALIRIGLSLAVLTALFFYVMLSICILDYKPVQEICMQFGYIVASILIISFLYRRAVLLYKYARGRFNVSKRDIDDVPPHK
jgi:hypothetical protein